MHRYQELKELYSQHGHSNVPTSDTNKQLSRWVTNQRQRRKMKQVSMRQERIGALDALHFKWVVTSNDKWQERILELKEYHRQHGNFKIPTDCPEYEKLGKWLVALSRAYHHGRTLSGKLAGFQ